MAIVSIVGLAVLLSVLAAFDPSLAMYVPAVGLLVVALIVLFSLRGTMALPRLLLWGAVTAPFLITTTRTAADVVSVTIGPTDLFRAAAPALLIGLYFLVAPSRLVRIGRADGWLAIYLIIALISAVWSLGATQTMVKAYLLGITYFGLLLLARSYNSLSEALNGLGAYVHLLLVAVCLEFLAMPGQAYAPVSDEGNVPRLSGLFPTIGPNLLAFLAVAGLLLLIADVYPRWARSLVVRIALAAAYSGILLATRTRTALALGGIVLAYAAVRLAQERVSAFALIVIVGLGCAAGAAIFFQQISDFVLRGQSAYGLSTLTGRTAAWTTAIQVWEGHPWLGLGFYSGHRIGLSALTSKTNLDNTWLETLLDIGVIGVAALALFVITGTVRMVRAWHTEPLWQRLVVHAVIGYFLMVSWVNPSIQANGTTQVMVGFLLLLPSAAELAGYREREKRAAPASRTGRQYGRRFPVVHHAPVPHPAAVPATVLTTTAPGR